MIEHLKSHWKGSDIYRLNFSTTPNFLHRPTMVTNIFEDFEPPSKKFLATSLPFNYKTAPDVMSKPKSSFCSNVKYNPEHLFVHASSLFGVHQ